jgi:hypothetical protein
MAWTYSGDPASSDRDAVRFYVGDTNTTEQLLQDAEVDFVLAQVATPLAAAARCARAIASKMAMLVDEKFESIDNKFSQRAKAFTSLAGQLEREVKRQGGLGTPVAGGISVMAVEAARSDTDRVRPAFREGQFAVSPAPDMYDSWP